MPSPDDRRYKISEVSEMLDVAQHVLRQWESRFPQLKPKRDRAKRRYYTTRDIEVARRIKQLLRYDKMTTAGARKRLAQEMHGEGVPKTRRAIDTLDEIEREVRTMLRLLDNSRLSS